MKKNCVIIASIITLIIFLVACAENKEKTESSPSLPNANEPVTSYPQDISDMSQESNRGDSSSIANDIVFDVEDFTEYFKYFADFFYSKADTPEDLQFQGRLQFFLLRTTYLESEAGNLPTLETNSDDFYLVPDESMRAVARKYLGIGDLDLSIIDNWLMGIDSSTGDKQYGLASSLPNSAVTVLEIEEDNNRVSVRALVNGVWDEEHDNTEELIYTFRLLTDGNKNLYYQFVSIE